jgi:hypothetical protein
VSELLAFALPPRWLVRHPHADDHARVQTVLGQWWAGFGGEAGARERAALLPRHCPCITVFPAGSTRGQLLISASASITMMPLGPRT